jgi:hypothetical protein
VTRNADIATVFMIVFPCAFTLDVGIWGFLSTKAMVERLSDWWDTVAYSLRLRR